MDPTEKSKTLTRISKLVSTKIGRALTKNENIDLIDFFDENVKYIDASTDLQLIIKIADAYIRYLSKSIDGFDGSNNQNIVHTANIKNIYINITNIFGLNTIDRFISEMNPIAKRRKAYLTLDSRYARFSDDQKHLQWDFIDNLTESAHSTNTVGKIRDITYVRMYSIVVNKFLSNFGRASILIEEFAAQSFMFPDGRRFHFVALLNDLQFPINIAARKQKINISNPILGTKPDFTIHDKYELLAGFKFNEGFFYFNKPITTLNTITVSIGDPKSLLIIPKYEFFNVPVSFRADDYLFPPVPGGIMMDLNFGYSHYHDGVRGTASLGSIFIDDFTTSNPIADKPLIDWINGREFTWVSRGNDSLTSKIMIVAINRDQPAGAVPWPINFPPGVTYPVGIPSNVRVRVNGSRVIMNFEIEYIAE